MRTLAVCMFATFAVAACGGDDDAPPATDAGIDALPNLCGTPSTTITTYPASYSGTTVGAGADLAVAEGACTEEISYFDPIGEDDTVVLTGLLPGMTYLATLTATTDLSMYLATACDATGPTAGSCLAFRDATAEGEEVTFTAPADGTVQLVIDSWKVEESGEYTLDVEMIACSDDPECSGATPYCVGFECVACRTSFDCTTAGAPVCDGATNTCVAGDGTCTGDTTGEPDNGPTTARMIGFPTAGMPRVTATASVCGTTNGNDWYKFTVATATTVGIALTWNAAATDLDYLVLDSEGTTVVNGISTSPIEEARQTMLAPGTYYLQVTQFVPSSGTPSNTPVAYTLTLALPECDFDTECTSAAAPRCSAAAICSPGADLCTGDVSEPDDGPAAARDLTGAIGVATSLPGAVCNVPTVEGDWYKVTTTAPGEGLTLNLAWTGTADFDIAVFDSAGRLEGLSFWKQPEVVTLTRLPAGVHYIRIQMFSMNPVPAAAAYTLSATRTLVQVCTAAADCATEFSTQIYRGSCNLGACEFIAPGTRAEGAACDSGDDCQSTLCSYFGFEQDAAESVCTKACTTNADCASLGAFTCTTGFQTNICVPSCGAALDCGADVNSTPVGTDTWSYFTCTAGVCG